jgi:Ca2+-binding RTX toxin-like protein
MAADEKIYSATNPLTATDITKLLVFGTTDPSSPDYNSHIRSKETGGPTIKYDMNDYMMTGAGRYAYPSLFGAVRDFFYGFDAILIAPGTYTYTTKGGKIESGGGLGFLEDKDFQIGISQYGTDITSSDYADRSYIFGSSGFAIKSITFQVDGFWGIPTSRYIKNINIRPLNDDFDFSSDNKLVQSFNDSYLKPLFDPYNLGKKVDLKFEVVIPKDAGKSYFDYGYFDFWGDVDRALPVSLKSNPLDNAKDAEGLLLLTAGSGLEYLEKIASETFISYEHNGLNVIYGTSGDDSLDRNSFKVKSLIFGKLLSPNPLFDGLLPPQRYLIVGGSGKDILTGYDFDDELQGGSDTDKLYGGAGKDLLDAGNEDNSSDYLYGGDGDDTLRGWGGDDDLRGDKNDDILWGFTGEDHLYGGDDQDKLYGQHDTDYLFGESGNDFLDGGDEDNANDYLWGGDGNDTLKGWGGDDELRGENDDDLLELDSAKFFR